MPTIKERYDANQIITTVEGTDLIPAQKSSDVVGKVLTIQQLKDYINLGIDEIEIEAKENIAIHKVVTINGYVANSNNVLHKNIICGVSISSVNTGFAVKIKTFGLVIGMSGLSANGIIYLNGTSLSHSNPTIGFLSVIGTAKSSDSMFVNIKQSILL